MNTLVPVCGTIEAYAVASGGTVPGPSSKFSYSINANIPGVGMVAMDGQVPCEERWADDIDCNPVRNGSVIGVLLGGSQPGSWLIQWHFCEKPAGRDCSGNDVDTTPTPPGPPPPPPPPAPPDSPTGSLNPSTAPSPPDS